MSVVVFSTFYLQIEMHLHLQIGHNYLYVSRFFFSFAVKRANGHICTPKKKEQDKENETKREKKSPNRKRFAHTFGVSVCFMRTHLQRHIHFAINILYKSIRHWLEFDARTRTHKRTHINTNTKFNMALAH